MSMWSRLGGIVLQGGIALCLCLPGASFADAADATSARPVTLPQVIYHGTRTEKRIALTFDACSSPHLSQVDKKVVQILLDHHIPATLFLGGKWVLDQPDEARYLASVPFFEIASHSFHHPHLTRLSAPEIHQELLAAQNAIEYVTGKTPRYFRAPYGEYNATLVRTAASLGLTTIQFDLASGDPDKSINADRLSRWVIREAKAGSIVVMHINTHGWHTAEALPGIIEALRAQGYTFVTISNLLKQPQPAPVLMARNDRTDPILNLLSAFRSH